MNILLHSCCGPCTIYPLTSLRSKDNQVTCYFYNPNIHPYKEFKRRLSTFTDYVQKEDVASETDDTYGLVEFTRAVVFNEKTRCSLCYRMRLTETILYAKRNNFEAFTTTLLYSRYQQHEKIQSICNKLSSQHGVAFYYEDFREGWQQGIDESLTQGMYRQPYCGCIYSEQERYDKSFRK